MPATVTPIRPGVVIVDEPVMPARRGRAPKPPCPVCGGPFAPGDHPWQCDSCHTPMHDPCYWGRGAPLAEWREYTRQMIEGDDDWRPDVLCGACRAKAGA